MCFALKRFVKAVFKTPIHLKIKFQTDLATLQFCMEIDEVTPTFFSQEKELNMKTLNVARQEEDVWILKSEKNVVKWRR